MTPVSERSVRRHDRNWERVALPAGPVLLLVILSLLIAVGCGQRQATAEPGPANPATLRLDCIQRGWYSANMPGSLDNVP